MSRLRRFVLRLKPPCGRSVRVFVALLATSGRYRLRVSGRVVAALAVVAWATLAAAAGSTTSILINLLCAASMLAEVWTVGGDC